MNELSIQIEVYPLNELSAGNIQTAINNPNSTGYQFSADYFNFEPTVEETNAGTLYNCNKDLVIDHPEEQIKQRFDMWISSIVRIKDTTGHEILIGTREVPAQVMISPQLQRSYLKIKCKMLKSPYLA